MNYKDEFIDLDKALHDRASFDSGEKEQNDFIRNNAARNMAVGIDKTRLLPAMQYLPSGKKPICAFYNVSPSFIEKETLPVELVEYVPNYSLPVFLLTRLAVHLDYRGHGLDKITLVNALEYLWSVNAYMKAFAVVVDCTNQAAQDFYETYGFEILSRPNGNIRMFLPMYVVANLFSNYQCTL